MLYNLLVFLLSIVARIVFRIKVHGNNKLPDGKLILCSNHISLVDPVILAVVTNRQISFMAKKELFDKPVLGWLISKVGSFPVDRKNADLKAIKESLKVLKEDRVLGIFPEGTRVKTVSLDNLKPGIGLIASRSGSDIQPVNIVSTYKLFSKVDVYFRDIINIDSYDLKSEGVNMRITEDIYKAIYNIEGELDDNKNS